MSEGDDGDQRRRLQLVLVWLTGLGRVLGSLTPPAAVLAVIILVLTRGWDGTETVVILALLVPVLVLVLVLLLAARWPRDP